MLAGTAFPIVPFGATALSAVGGACFVGMLAAASLSDLRQRRIPNVLVAWLAVVGMCYSLLVLSPAVGASRALIGLVIGFGLWIPFYALGMLGAGDVKLFAAACCWLAPSQAFTAAVLSAVAGGVLSVVGLVLAHGVGLTTFRIAHAMRDPKLLATPLSVPAGRPTLPYGLAMAIGLSVAGWFPGLLRLM
jgi:prepilin peptidase CpaA